MKPRAEKAQGYSVCCCVFDDDGLLLRVLPDSAAARRWTRKHFGSERKTFRTFRSRRAVSLEFDRQMQLGLTSVREIDDLLVYAGVATSWKGPQAKREGAA